MASKKKRSPNPPPPPVRKKPAAAKGAPEGPTPKQLAREQRAKAERRTKLRTRLVTAGLVAAALVGLVVYLVADRRADAELRETLTAGSCEVDTEADPTGPPGQNHVPTPVYRVDPPAGGDHLPSAARAGVYRGANVPPDGQLVHSLEHGYVVAWYAPGTPAEEVAELEALQQEHPEDVIVAERQSLEVPVAATAWGQRLLCGEAEPAALERFVDAHVGNGPEDVPRG